MQGLHVLLANLSIKCKCRSVKVSKVKSFRKNKVQSIKDQRTDTERCHADTPGSSHVTKKQKCVFENRGRPTAERRAWRRRSGWRLTCKRSQHADPSVDCWYAHLGNREVVSVSKTRTPALSNFSHFCRQVPAPAAAYMIHDA